MIIHKLMLTRNNGARNSRISFAAGMLLVVMLIFTLAGCDSGGSGQFNYLLRLPDSQYLTSPAPLIIGMHGYSDSNGNFERNSGLTRVATQKGYIVVYPKSPSLGWNAGGSYFTRLTGGSDDISYILGIIEEMKQLYDIDENRIYLTGHSNGAFMAYHLAACVPSTFAAIAPVAGTMMTHSIETATPVSIMHIHGLADTAVPFRGDCDFPAVESVLELWKTKNSCADPFQNDVSANIAHRSWQGQRAEMQLFTDRGLAHVWPPYASSYIVAFFDDHQLYKDSTETDELTPIP